MAGFPKGDKRIADKARRPQPGVKMSTDSIITALKTTRGNIGRAADKLGCCRQALHSRINAEIEIKTALDALRERFIDDTEDVLQAKVLDGDTTSMLFVLKTLGRKRGYDIERDVIAEGATRGVLDWIANKSKNPAES